MKGSRNAVRLPSFRSNVGNAHDEAGVWPSMRDSARFSRVLPELARVLQTVDNLTHDYAAICIESIYQVLLQSRLVPLGS